MKKILFSFLFILAHVVSAVADGTTGSCVWSYDEETKTLTITGKGPMGNYAYDVSDNGWGITSIPWNKYSNEIENVVVAEGVTSIGSGAFFSHKSLHSVSIPSTVTSIGHLAFEECTQLESIVIPSNVKTIGHYAFENCSGLTSVTIESNITYLAYWVFAYCSSLRSVSLPESLTAIKKNAFYGSGIESIVIPDKVVTIEDYAFCHCEDLTSVTVGKRVSAIGNYAFSDCNSLRAVHVSDLMAWCSITFKDNPLINAKHLFMNDEEVRHLSLPAGITSISSSAFHGCESLESVTMPPTVRSIGFGAFWQCINLTELSIGENVASIGSHAFAECEGLATVSLPSNLETIDNAAFCYCGKLATVTIPDRVTLIGGDAFYGCESLHSAIIGSSAKSIGSNAFGACNNLISVKVNQPEPAPITYMTFSNCANSTLFVPKGSKTAYEVADYWKDFKEIVEVNMPGQKEYQTLALRELPVLNYGDEPYQLPIQTGEGLPLHWEINSEKSVAHFNDSEDWLLVIDASGETLLTATQEGNEEYEPFYKEFALTVEKAPLAITAEDCTRQYGEENPELTFRYDGFVYDEDESVLKVKPTVITTASKDSPAGEYPITVTGAEADNYEITYVDGTLTISDELARHNVLRMGDIVSRGGKQVELPVALDNDQTIVGISFTLRLPEGVEVMTDEDGDPICEFNPERMGNRQFSATAVRYEDGAWGFRIASTNGDAAVKGNEGNILSIKLSVRKGMEDGDYTIRLRDNVLSVDRGNHDIQSLPIYDAAATLTLNSIIMGDVNGDEEVDLSDAIMVTYYSLNVRPTNFIEAAADTNADGRIDLSDAIVITYMSLGVYDGGSKVQRNARSVEKRESDQAELVYAEPVRMQPGEEVPLDIRFEIPNDQYPYVGFMFFVDLPSGLSLVEDGENPGYPWYDDTVDAIAKMSITTTESNGFAATPRTTNASINGGEGVLMRLKLKADDTLAPGSTHVATLRDVSLNVRDEYYNVEKHSLDNASFVVTIDEPTGIMDNGSCHTDTRSAISIYDLQGRKISRQQHGVNILRMEDGTTRKLVTGKHS